MADLDQRLLNLQVEFRIVADQVPVVLSWIETEEDSHPRFELIMPPPDFHRGFVRIENGPLAVYQRLPGIPREKFVRLAELGGELLLDFTPGELSPGDASAGRAVLDCDDPAERWYRLLTIRKEHEFATKRIRENSKPDIVQHALEDFGYASELMIGQLLTAVASRPAER